MPTSLRLEFAAILQFHIDAIGAVDHVMVREDEAVRPHDEAGAFALHRRRAARIAARRFWSGRPWKNRSSSVGLSLPSFFFVTSMITTLGATISNTFVNALFS